MELSQERDSLMNGVNTLKADIREFLQSGNFYCTEEIARELTAIDNGLEHLKLDNRLLLSDERNGSFRSSEAQASVAGKYLKETQGMRFNCELEKERTITFFY